jgi:sulfite exporter TauE/SafE/copper chaperone CopZ
VKQERHERKTARLRVGGMTCAGCQNKIEKRLRGTYGVEDAAVSYAKGTAVVAYRGAHITQREIEAVIRRLDYTILETDEASGGAGQNAAGILLLILAAALLLRHTGLWEVFNRFPTAEAGMGYGLLFAIGLFTSLHCVAMCGGINLSQCLPRGASGGLRPALWYNAGRVLSYTAIGALVGALGSVVSFSGSLRGLVQLLAGVFMVVMGLNLLGIFPALRRFVPGLPRVFSRKIEGAKGNAASPLVVGLLNGLMPCGPLQAMQLYALSTGSPLRGGVSMLLFSLGTVPLMFGLGSLSALLSKKFTRNVMTAGASLVVVLGVSMFASGWSLSNLSGVSLSGLSGGETGAPEILVENGVQVVRSTLASGRYPAITVAAGTPVRWVIDAPPGSLNGCNNKMQIPAYGVEHQFQIGENVIEFTPTQAGKVSYSCWMGMIRSTITINNEQ